MSIGSFTENLMKAHKSRPASFVKSFSSYSSACPVCWKLQKINIKLPLRPFGLDLNLNLSQHPSEHLQNSRWLQYDNYKLRTKIFWQRMSLGCTRYTATTKVIMQVPLLVFFLSSWTPSAQSLVVIKLLYGILSSQIPIKYISICVQQQYSGLLAFWLLTHVELLQGKLLSLFPKAKVLSDYKVR